MKKRIKFSKIGKMKFVGHLDLLKLFQRAVKRADIPIAYSKGFNPHQKMSFASPLSVGTESMGEYVDIRLENDDLENEEIKRRLNDVLPIGMEILNIRDFEENEKNAAAVVEAALYEIEFDREIENAEGFFSDEMLIEKIGKKGSKEVNIKEDIFEVNAECVDGKSCIRALIAAGSRRNLKPELLAEYIYRAAKEEFKPYCIKYKRIEMFKRVEGEFVPLI